MRNQSVLAILLLSLITFSFADKNYLREIQTVSLTKKANRICGPSFDSLYNQHSTAFISNVNVHDPLGNAFDLGFGAEPGDVYSISDAGSQCGFAGGTYHFFLTISNSAFGSVAVLDQFNNVVYCSNITSSTNFLHVHFVATCATTYRIVISNYSC